MLSRLVPPNVSTKYLPAFKARLGLSKPHPARAAASSPAHLRDSYPASYVSGQQSHGYHSTRLYTIRSVLPSPYLSSVWSTVPSLARALIVSSAGFLGASWAIQTSDAAEDKHGEVKVTLQADPWTITGEQEPKRDERTVGEVLLSWLWRTFKLLTGITLMEHIFRTVVRVFSLLVRETFAQTQESLIDWLVKVGIDASDFRRPVDPYIFLNSFSQWLSALSGTSASYLGPITLLDKQTIDALPGSLRALQSRTSSHVPTWFLPHISSLTYEDMYLTSQYSAFLVTSQRDGAVYRIEGYFGLLPTRQPIPLVLYYTKVAESLDQLKKGQVLDSFAKKLNRYSKLGDDADVKRDMTADFRALQMPFDVGRMFSKEDWIKYIGVECKDAILTREKAIGPESETWKLKGPSGAAVLVRIHNEPEATASQLTIILPETSTSLEEQVIVPDVTVYCARWCAYAEQNPFLKKLLGADIHLSSSPAVQMGESLSDDTFGDIANCWFRLTGTKSSATMHLKMLNDEAADRRRPATIILSVSAKTDDGLVTHLYANPSKRYENIVDSKRGKVHVIEVTTDPYLATDLLFIPRQAQL